MIKKWFPCSFVLFLLVMVFTAVAHSRTVRVCIYEGFPLSFRDAAGQASGLFNELLKEIARREQWSLQYRYDIWENCLRALKDGVVDVVPAIAESPERARFFRFSRETVLVNWGVLITAKGRSIESIVELRGKKIAVLSEDVYVPALVELLNRFQIEVEYIKTSSYDSVVSMVESGQADMGLTNRMYATFSIGSRNVQSTPVVVHPVGIKFAGSMNDPFNLLDIIDRHVQDWKADANSFLYRAISHWLQTPEEASRSAIMRAYLYAAFTGVLILAILAFVLRTQLRRKVHDIKEVTGRLVDVAAKQRAMEAALADAENWYRAVFEKADDALIILDEKGTILECNSSACRFFQAVKEQLIGKTPMDLSPELQPDGSPSQRKGSRLLESTLAGCPQRFEWLHETPNGEAISAEVQLSLMFQSGEARILACVRDVTQKKVLELEQAKQREYLQTVLDGIPIALFVIDLQGRVVFWNKMCETITGMSQREVLTRPLNLKPILEGKDLPIPALLLLEMTPQEFIQKHPKWKAQPLPFHSEGVQLTGKIVVRGQERHMSIVAARLRDRHGELLGVVQCARDITQEIQMQKQLLHSQKMDAVGKLSAGIAHDFNNILTIILGCCDLIRKKSDLNAAIKKRVDEIEKAAERASNLTRQLLAFSRKQVMRAVPLDLNRLIDGLSPILRRAVGEDIEIRQQLSQDLWAVLADPVFIEQILLNLIINARDAMQGGGLITVETRNEAIVESRNAGLFVVQPGEYVCLQVRDTGHGIDPEIQHRIFEPFFTTKPEGRGSGLGLATVYGIVKQLGGYTLVQSSKGQGATFQILFPRTTLQVDNPSTARQERRQEWKGSETILVVEDEESLRAMVQEVLRDKGYHVVTASSGKEALEILERAPKVDLVVTDVVMPEMNGVKLGRWLAERMPSVPILFISGYTDDQLAHRGILLPDVHFLPKPFSSEKLLHTVQLVLSQKRNRSK